MERTPTFDQENFWRAVLARDNRFDGTFVFAVRSTGIYCRPSCPARRPGPEQVLFFTIPEAAEQAGYRACRRCQPRKARVNDRQAEMVQLVCRYIETNLDGGTKLADLSSKVKAHPHHLQRTFKAVMGITPRQYADALRLRSLKGELRRGQSVAGAIYGAGYGSSSRLYEKASSQLGMTPSTYRRGGQGMHIRYTVVDSPLGRLLVAATERGICAVSLGESDETLKRALSQEYPRAEIESASPELKKWTSLLLDHLKGKHPDLNLPLDVQATAFQRRVWEELKSIPYGTTRTYSEIARRLKNAKATRAVARSCATNPAAIVIPCHRVVRKDGDLGGYRWGIQRKRALLDLEKG